MALSKLHKVVAGMFPVLLLFVFPLFSLQADARQVTGTLTDAQSGKLIAAVCIINRDEHSVVYSNDSGFFSIEANVGDTLLIRHPSYITLKRVVPANSRLGIIKMTVSGYSLDEVTITSKRKDYKRDSLERQIIYRKTLKDATERPKVNFSNGFAVSGLISAFARKVSGQSKKLKRFKKQFDADERERFIRSRYNVEMVQRFTRVDADSAMLFIKTFPMETAFARAATELEMAMWVRERYRKWIGKSK